MIHWMPSDDNKPPREPTQESVRKYAEPVSRWSPGRPVLAVLAVLHVIVTVLTLRDLNQRSDAQLRGPRGFWRVFAPLQMGNSALYWLVGRRSDG